MRPACKPKGHSHECDCGRECMTVHEGRAIIDLDLSEVRPMHYTTLNCVVRKAMRMGCSSIELKGVMGQRYLASTASSAGLYIAVHGTPGNDLGAFLNGPTIEVFGNAQDMTGNTMNSGRIIVHGNAWDVTGLAARGGTIMVKGDTGYRVGIHMKEYGQAHPTLLVGGTAKDYLGEYMAGGTILVLGLGNGPSPVGRNVGAGMHGGRIFVRGSVARHQLGPGASISPMNEQDREEVSRLLDEFDTAFGTVVPRDLEDYVKIAPSSSRPFSGYYDKTSV
ncbi:MAG: Tungsten-containing formylmethanofuran dehydrogenase 2 subunit C [Methanomassiliicoccales archaeon PtaB.Bin134]|nr:MAG: Tungsten-containing formylmethanofuran dehydrogenase 2 subunit C [Methanomassiliicoccales archaeon PtaB.Bin134]